MSSTTITIKELAQFELLKGLTDKELEQILLRLKLKHFQAGKVIFHEGDKTGTVFFLISGEVEISKALTLPMAKTKGRDSRAKSIISLSGESGPVFGELSLFTEEDSRTATVIATTDCRMGLLTARDFFQVLDGNPIIGYKVMRNLTRIVSKRLTTANLNVLKLTTALTLVLEK